MLLTEIAAWVNLGTNNQITPEQMSVAMDAVQKNIFQRNQQAFLVYDQVLSIWQNIDVASYSTALTQADIGKTVGVYGSTETGILRAFDSTSMKIETKDNFPSNLNFTIDGSITGVLADPVNQYTFRGPYYAPNQPPCRKIWGVTKKSPGKFWLDYMYCWGFVYSIDGIWQTEDYRAFWGNRLYPFVTGNTFDLDNSFLFSFDPGLHNDKQPYYWVYWKNPPDITGLDDSSVLLIPSAYHFNFASAVKQVCQVFLQDSNAGIDKIVDDNLGGWIDALLAPFRSEWRASNMTQQASSGWI